MARKSSMELDNEVVLHLPTIIPVSPEHTSAADMVLGRPYGLTIIAKRQELFDESLAPTVSPLGLRRRVPSLNQLSGRGPCSPQPHVSAASGSPPSIETRFSQSEDETAEPSPVSLTRSRSLPVRPTTPKRRQSALITQKIKALNAAAEPPEPIFDRSGRKPTRSLPIPLVSA